MNEIKCKDCEYCVEYVVPLHRVKETISIYDCSHPDQAYIGQYFMDHREEYPIGLEPIVIEKTQKWCPRKKEEFNMSDEEIIKLRESNNPVLMRIADDLEESKRDTEKNEYEKVLEQLERKKDLAYADFDRYAEEKGLDKEQDFFSEGMKRAIEIVKGGGHD